MHGPHSIVKYLSRKSLILVVRYFFKYGVMLLCSERDKTKLLDESSIFVLVRPQVAQAQFVSVIITLLNSDNLQVLSKHLLTDN